MLPLLCSPPPLCAWYLHVCKWGRPGTEALVLPPIDTCVSSFLLLSTQGSSRRSEVSPPLAGTTCHWAGPHVLHLPHCTLPPLSLCPAGWSQETAPILDPRRTLHCQWDIHVHVYCVVATQIEKYIHVHVSGNSCTCTCTCRVYMYTCTCMFNILYIHENTCVWQIT